MSVVGKMTLFPAMAMDRLLPKTFRGLKPGRMLWWYFQRRFPFLASSARIDSPWSQVYMIPSCTIGVNS